jgi:hypothetical protein
VGYARQLHNLWLEVVAGALPSSAVKGFDDDAGRAIRQAMAADESAVAVFQKLVGSYRSAGRTAGALEILQQCRNLMTEQGLAEGPETRSYLESVMGR